MDAAKKPFPLTLSKTRKLLIQLFKESSAFNIQKVCLFLVYSQHFMFTNWLRFYAFCFNNCITNGFVCFYLTTDAFSCLICITFKYLYKYILFVLYTFLANVSVI